MKSQIYYEDIAEGQLLPVLKKNPTRRQLVKWAGVSGDYYEIHYDDSFAKNRGLPGVIVHGALTASSLAQLVTDWAGADARVKKLNTSNRAMLFPNEDMICKGNVTRKYKENTEHLVECEIWAENPRGERCVTGSATISLPTRKSQ